MVLLAFALYWLAVNILIPGSLLNSALIFSLMAWRNNSRRLLLAAIGVVGGFYLLIDLSNGWFSVSFLRDMLKEKKWLDLIVYVNSAAIALNASFLVTPFWKKADALPETLKGKSILMRISTIVIVGIASAAIPLIYDNGNLITEISPQTFNDNSVQIGEQVWMAENLDITVFRNGDPIPEAKTKWEWEEAGRQGMPAWCQATDGTFSGKVGKLYNWYAVNDPRGLAPVGWRIPSDEEWSILVMSLGGNNKAGVKLKSSIHWHKVNKKGGNGNNASRFNALPVGNRNSDGELVNMTMLTLLWSSSEDRNGEVWSRELNYENHRILRDSYSKSCGFSVRCIKEADLDTSSANSNGISETKDNSYESSSMDMNSIQTANSKTDENLLKQKHLNYLSPRIDGRTVKMKIVFGDLNSDGLNDAFIDWCIEANDEDRNVGGGNALMSLACIEEGFSVYINTGNIYVLSVESGKDKFTEGEPNSIVDSIKNGRIICSILSYTDLDPRCCPSMKKTFYLVFKKKYFRKRQYKAEAINLISRWLTFENIHEEI